MNGAFKKNGGASLGVVIRDDAGKVLLSAWRVVANASNAEEVEILACKEGLALAVEWTPCQATLESDCSSVIKYLSDLGEQRTPPAFVIREAKKLASTLPGIVFKHVRREQNYVAHELAQLASGLFHSVVWRNRYPVCIEPLVVQDCNSALSDL